MKYAALYFVVIVALALVSGNGVAADAKGLEASAAPNGTLSLTSGGNRVCDFVAGLFDESWRSASAVAVRGKVFSIKEPTGSTISGEASFTRNAAGAVVATYTFTPPADVTLASLNVSADFAVGLLVGTKWKMDDAEGTFPAEHKETSLNAAKIKMLKLAPAKGPEMTLTFDAPMDVLLQDNRQWNTQTFSLRIGRGGSFKGGEAATISFTLSTGAPIALTIDEPVVIVAGPDWIPLKTELDIEAGSALDFSKFGMTEAPAGKYGRVICGAGGQFVFENDKKTPRRFYGVNLCFTGQFMTHPEAEKLAERFSRLGYNAVRIHHYEGELTKGKKSTELNDEKVDQLDYLFFALAKRGIYITTDLFVSRPVSFKDVGIDKKGNVGMDDFKIMIPARAEAYENWKAFSKALLTHVNKYTGHSYADEPALAWISLINEGCFGNFTKQMQAIPEWKTLWNEWLAKKYASREELAKAWGDALKADEDATKMSVATPNNVYGGNARSRDENLFLVEKEREMVIKMKDFLRNEIHCNALITNSNAWTNHATDQLKREVYDYVDDHFYVDHPQFLQGDWHLPSKCDNASPLASGATGGRACAFTRLFDKPFTITEYNYAGPGRYRGVGGILTGAMGALQGWSGIWRFAYAHDHSKLFAPVRMDYFDMVGDPLGQAAERASLCLFLRGDMKMAPHAAAIDMNESDLRNPPAKIPKLAASWHWAAWVTRIGTRILDVSKPGDKELSFPLNWTWVVGDSFSAYESTPFDVMSVFKKEGIVSDANKTDPAKNYFRSETDEVTIDAPNDQLTLNTSKTVGGYAKSGATISTSGVTIQIQDTDATVWVSSLDAEPIATSKRLLVTHLTDLQNSGIRYAEGARKTLLDWGNLPHLVRNGKAAVRLTLGKPETFDVFALSTGGKRLGKVATQVKDGYLEFTADVNGNPEEGARMLYEIVAK